MPDDLAVRVFGRLAADDERLERFLAETGLQPSSVRAAAAAPGFLPAVMDHVARDEALLVAIADELDLAPETLARACVPPEQPDDW